MKPITIQSAALAVTASLVALSAVAAPPVAPVLQLQNLPAGLSAAEVQSHEIAPASLRGIQIEETDPAKEFRLKIIPRSKPPKADPKLDVGEFGKAAHAALKDQVTGYTLQVRQNGNLVYNLIWNWSRTPTDGSAGWKGNTRMHLASVSKWLTAVGLVKTLDAKGISYDAKIINYLPTYWTKGKNIDQITFRHLMTHRSGFEVPGSDTDFATMKAEVAAGVTSPGQSSGYENVNYALCRILIPIINGDVNKNQSFMPIPPLQDQCWDAITVHHYKKYMQAKVFSPAGVALADFKPSMFTPDALAYKFPHAGQDGWNSGDLKSVSGGAGWRLSIEELMRVMDHVRRKGDIISPAKAQYLLDAHFGIDQTIDTAAGKIYNKNGSWGSGGRTEQCVAYFMPDNIEVAVFVNSPIGPNTASLRGLVKDLYVNALD